MSRRISSRVRSKKENEVVEDPNTALNQTSTSHVGFAAMKESSDNSGGSSVSTTSSMSGDNGSLGRLGPLVVSNASSSRRDTPFGILYSKYGQDLSAMVDIFDTLELELRTLPGQGQSQDDVQKAVNRHTKLVTFIKHLKRTREQLMNGPLDPTCETTEAGYVDSVIKTKLLPVYQRLKKQKGDSRGAQTNPKGAPVNHPAFNNAYRKANSGPPIKVVKAAPTMFGNPLGKGGSSLTQKLHGTTLGSQTRRYGYGVGSTTPVHSNISSSPKLKKEREEEKQQTQPRVLRGGMAPGSETVLMPPPFIAGLNEIPKPPLNIPEQHHPQASSRTAAEQSREAQTALKQTTQHRSIVNMKIGNLGPGVQEGGNGNARVGKVLLDKGRLGSLKTDSSSSVDSHDHYNTVMEQELLREHIPQQTLNIGGKMFPLSSPNALMKKPRKKRRKESRDTSQNYNQVNHVEYLCSECNDLYPATVTQNPWWVVNRVECPKCHKQQIPRIDISLPANLINYHPALVAHENDEDSESGHHHLVFKGPIDESNKGMSLGVGIVEGAESESESDEESDTGEDFGDTYSGPKYNIEEASKLAKLMLHARTCPGRHKNEKHREVCQSVKFMMLHVRDCTGTVANSTEPCPYPWCRKTKNLVYHIASCNHPQNCRICGVEKKGSENYCQLAGLNRFRLKEERCRVVEKKKFEEKERLEKKQEEGRREGEVAVPAEGVILGGVTKLEAMDGGRGAGIFPVKQPPTLVVMGLEENKVVSDGTLSDDADSGGGGSSPAAEIMHELLGEPLKKTKTKKAKETNNKGKSKSTAATATTAAFSGRGRGRRGGRR